jgi:hypothetical protein
MLSHNQFTIYTIAKRIASEPTFSLLYEDYPFQASIMLDMFKSFLTMSEVTKQERQLLLVSALHTQKNLNLVRDIVDFCKNCEMSEDYQRVVMEWTYNHSEKLTKLYLDSLDASELSCNKNEISEESLLVKTKSMTSDNFLSSLNIFNFNSSEDKNE